MTCVALAAELGRVMRSEKVEQQLLDAFNFLACITVADLKELEACALQERLKEVGLEYTAWTRQLNKVVFGVGATFSFKVLPSRCNSIITNASQCLSSSQSSGMSQSLNVQSHTDANGEKYLDCEQLKFQATESIGGYNNWPYFQFPELMQHALTQALSVGKIDDKEAMRILFRFHLLIFESRFVNSHQKTRYAVLLNKYNTSLNVEFWQEKNQSSFSNKRGGRFTMIRFHPKEMTPFILELEAHKFNNKVISDVSLSPILSDSWVIHVLELPLKERACYFLNKSDGERIPNARNPQRARYPPKTCAYQCASGCCARMVPSYARMVCHVTRAWCHVTRVVLCYARVVPWYGHIIRAYCVQQMVRLRSSRKLQLMFPCLFQGQ